MPLRHHMPQVFESSVKKKQWTSSFAGVRIWNVTLSDMDGIAKTCYSRRFNNGTRWTVETQTAIRLKIATSVYCSAVNGFLKTESGSESYKSLCLDVV